MRVAANTVASMENVLFVFYDLETRLDPKTDACTSHVPNLCVAQQACRACIDREDAAEDCPSCGQREFVFAEDPIAEFVAYLLSESKYRRVVAIAHYGGGFEALFIFKHLVELASYRVKPTVITKGSKIIGMNFCNVRFLDSFNYFHLPLSALPKAYGFTGLQKGYFPHLFNVVAHQRYVGPMPLKDT